MRALAVEAGASSGRAPPAKTAMAAMSFRRSPTALQSDVLEVVRRQMRQNGGIDLIPLKILLVLAEAQTAKPPADIHRCAPHG